MSNDDSGEKTEDPTSKKMDDARDKGQVAQSKDIVSAIVVCSVSLYFVFYFYYLFDALSQLMLVPARFYQEPFLQALSHTMGVIWERTLAIMFPIVFLAAIAGIFANFMQIGAVFSFEPLMPKLDKLDPVAGFKRLFQAKNLVEFLKSLIKVAALALTCFFVVRHNLEDLLKIPVCGKLCLPPVLGHLMFQLIAYSMLVFIFLAVSDLFFQKYNHKKELRMTKDEVKKEYKETQGNPEIKGERKKLHREILDGSAVSKAVKKSTVVVTNPTHYAVVLRYVSSEKRLPQVLIKGEGAYAQRIKKSAYEESIPMMENIYLARLLYAETKEYSLIPRHLIEPVAEVIRWVNDLKRAEQEMKGEEE